MINLPNAIVSLPPSPGAGGATAPPHEVARLWAAVSWLRTVSNLIAAKGDEAVTVFSLAQEEGNFKEAAEALGIDAKELASLAEKLGKSIEDPAPKKKQAKIEKKSPD